MVNIYPAREIAAVGSGIVHMLWLVAVSGYFIASQDMILWRYNFV